MTRIQKVLLCGHSLFISGLQACLEAIPGVQLQRVEAETAPLQERLIGWKPDVLILGLEDLQHNLSLVATNGSPQLITVGLDNESDRLLVLTGQVARAMTINELLHVIQPEGQLFSVSKGGKSASPQT